MDPDDRGAVAGSPVGSTIEVGERVVADGTDVTDAVRSPEVSAAVSAVAANPAVRTVMVERQRAWVVAHGGGVVEGRDIGSVVLPDADLKLYLTAPAEVGRPGGPRRVPMRWPDGTDWTAPAASPLEVPEGARVIDTGDLGWRRSWSRW